MKSESIAGWLLMRRGVSGACNMMGEQAWTDTACMLPARCASALILQNSALA